MTIRPKALIAAVLLILALAFTTGESAYASQSVQPHPGPAKISAPAKAGTGKSGKATDETDYCVAGNTAPFFVTYHGSLNGQSDVECPAPFQECRIQVDLDKEGLCGSYTVANKDYGWGACPSAKGKIYSVAYKCAGWDANNFTVVVSLSGLADGVTQSDVGVGKTATVDCI